MRLDHFADQPSDAAVTDQDHACRAILGRRLEGFSKVLPGDAAETLRKPGHHGIAIMVSVTATTSTCATGAGNRAASADGR